jgi:hypothetical protein
MPGEVVNCSPEHLDLLAGVAEHEVALGMNDAANPASLMAVVNRLVTIAQRPSADRAASAL